MSDVLIYGGTTEGRVILEILKKHKIKTDVCVATEYGEQVLEDSSYINVLVGRKTTEQMKDLYKINKYKVIIDATHPFATTVSENIKSSINQEIPLIRFERYITDCNNNRDDDSIYVNNTQECIEKLCNTSGNIFLTTGSKDLRLYTQIPLLKDRLVVRVLPGVESLQLCYEAGLEGKQIIAMQGPFSEEMNYIQIKDYNISVMVTKQSGKTGGVDTKLKAAKKAGIQTIIINNPDLLKQQTSNNTSLVNYYKTNDIISLCKTLSDILKTEIITDTKKNVILAGIGPGKYEYMTGVVQEVIKKADCIIGAKRMITTIKCNCPTYDMYKADEILNLIKQQNQYKNIVVLYSGDTGFYSGSSSLFNLLKKEENINVSVLPGISSIQYLSSKCGFAWQSMDIISLHGVSKEEWGPKVISAIKKEKDIFCLTSGIEDVKSLAEIMLNNFSTEIIDNYIFIVGYQLSYENEKIIELTAKDCLKLEDKGLYSLILKSKLV